MDNVICKADIRRDRKNMLLIIWYIILAIMLCLSVVWFKSLRFRRIYMHMYGVEVIITYIILLTSFITLLVFLLMIKWILSYIENSCSLKLTESGIEGRRKKLFSSTELKLPIDKVDNIMVRSNVYCALFGGNIVEVSSASGLVRFPFVQNAEEFVNATLAKIEEYKKR